jgi:hypothetical protein
MKKLILVTVLAVAASWLLQEWRSTDSLTATLEPETTATVIVRDDPPVLVAPPVEEQEPGTIRTIPWRPARVKSDQPTRKAVSSKSSPKWFPKTEADEEAKARPDAFGSRVLLGRLSASEDRARQDLRQIVEREVSSWLAADIPPSWKVPAPAINAMVQGRYTQEVTKDLVPTAESSSKPEDPGLYTLYRAGQKLDFSPTHRAEIVGMYRRDLASARMQRLGGGLALALVGLAVLSGYIKADEATKGYYTNRLRLAAAAGLGAAGVAAYRFLV